jgi:glycosyltransferase involved in cell wall biosynthesis
MVTSSQGGGRVAEPRLFQVVVLGRSFYGLHGFGGLERHLYDLVRYHLEAGWQVTVITRTPQHEAGVDPDRWAHIARHPNCAVRFVDYRTFPLAGRAGTTILDRGTAYPWFGRRAGHAAADFVAAGRADLVYGVGASVWGYASARRRGATAPLVFNPQGMEEFGGIDGGYGGHTLKAIGYAPLRAVVRDCARASDAVIVTDEAIVPAVHRHLPVEEARVRLIPNGLDVAELDRHVNSSRRRDVRHAAGIADDETLVLSVGRLEANKGFPDLAEALAGLDPGVRWRWILAGDGPARAALVSTFDRLRIANRVTLVGRVDDATLHSWYDAADLFVHPTRYEGSSLVTLEAMLHRLPVVATRAGGLPDKVKPGETGWLTEPSSPDALRRTIHEALAGRDRWRDYGDAGRRLLEQTFDWRVLQLEFAALYEELTAQTRANRRT